MMDGVKRVIAVILSDGSPPAVSEATVELLVPGEDGKVYRSYADPG